MKRFLILIITNLLVFHSFSQSATIDNVYNYIKEDHKSPEEYIISKFKDYDLVFLGEHHRIKHDVDFVASLIPTLYKNGITNLGYEFYEHTIQHSIYSLLSADSWDEGLVHTNLSKGFGVTWGYAEYINVLKEIWKFNKTLNVNQLKFRLIPVNTEFYPCKKGMDRFGGKNPELTMAQCIEQEVISKKQKALIYCGMHHAFTSYKQPIYDFEKNEFQRFIDDRFGNIIHQKYPDKTFTIFLHAPWFSDKGLDKPFVKPANGVIDSVMCMLDNKPCGFDVKNTPPGMIESTNTLYAYGYPNFKLMDFCDGYIFLNPFSNYKNVSVEENYYHNDHNFQKMKEFLKCMGGTQDNLDKLTVEQVIEQVADQVKVEKKLEHLWKTTSK